MHISSSCVLSFLFWLLLIPQLRWHNDVLKQPVISRQIQTRWRGGRRWHGDKRFLFIKPQKWGTKTMWFGSSGSCSTCKEAQIRGTWSESVRHIKGLQLLVVIVIWDQKWGGSCWKTTAVGCSGFWLDYAKAALRRSGAEVGVLALVSGDNGGGILGRSLHPLLHSTPCSSATIVAPRIRAVLDGFLAVLPPPVAVVEVIDLALGHERKSRLPLPFLVLLFGFQPELAHINKHSTFTFTRSSLQRRQKEKRNGGLTRPSSYHIFLDSCLCVSTKFHA